MSWLIKLRKWRLGLENYLAIDIAQKTNAWLQRFKADPRELHRKTLQIEPLEDRVLLNAAPMITSAAVVSVVEGTTDDFHTVTAFDPESDPVTFSTSGGNDQLAFSLNSLTGGLSFITPPDFDFPTDFGLDNTYEVEVTADDTFSPPATQLINVTVTQATGSFLITSASTASVLENTTSVMTVTASDPNATFRTWRLVGGP